MKAEDFKTSKKVGDSLFKGAVFHKNDGSEMPKQEEKPSAKPVSREPATPIEFNSLSDEDKSAFSYALDDWQQAIKNPNAWAKQQAQILKVNPKSLQKAAARMKQDLAAASPDDVFRYPWWSAARNWDPNAVGQLGQTVANGLTPSNDLISGIQSGPRLW